MFDEIRRSQIITTFGVGSITDFRQYSAVLKSPEIWDPMVIIYLQDEQRIDDPRLANLLDVEYFISPPPKTEKGPKLPFTLFPRMLYCPSCKTLKDVKYWLKKNIVRSDKLICSCRAKDDKFRFTRLLPSRFIVICPKGHIDDFPYDNWVHKYKECDKSNKHDYEPEFEYHAIGGGASLEDIKIKCKNCKISRSLTGGLSNNYHKNYVCSGYRPDLHNKKPYHESCNIKYYDLRFVLRNASNVYFPIIYSSLLIPPYSTEIALNIQSLTSYKYLFEIYCEGSPSYEKVLTDCVNKSSSMFNISKENARELILDMLTSAGKSKNIDEYKYAEYSAFLNETSSDDNFRIKQLFVNKLKDFKLNNIVRCDRLREVRVFSGYTRIKPIDNSKLISENIEEGLYNDKISISTVYIPSKYKTDWMLGVELYGEGMFLSFNNEILEKIEISERDIINRMNILYKNKSVYENETGFNLHNINSRFIAIHTLSHILIRRIAFESGYSLPSLRERIYCNTSERSLHKNMNGLLIYTADSDVEGTLGGLSRLTDDNILYELINNSMDEAEWCSSDPVCRESKGQGIGSLNLAACHSCCLLPETCCEYGNKFLDRVIMDSCFGKYEN